jgi:hypothetical protein
VSGSPLITVWGEFAAGAYCHLRDRNMELATAADWDVERISACGDVLLWSVNQAGASIPRAQRAGKELALPELPTAMITAIDLASDASLTVIQLDSATRPPLAPVELAVLDPSGEGIPLTRGECEYGSGGVLGVAD